MLPQTDAPHATLINNWIDINTPKIWINYKIWKDFIVWTSFDKISTMGEQFWNDTLDVNFTNIFGPAFFVPKLNMHIFGTWNLKGQYYLAQ